MSDRDIMSSKYNNANSTDEQSTKTIHFRDPVVERVVDSFVSRSDIGYAKYGRTLHQERTGGHKDLLGYLNDIQEELMDAVLYIQAAREEMKESMRWQGACNTLDRGEDKCNEARISRIHDDQMQNKKCYCEY